MSFNLPFLLDPYTKYTLWVRAFTEKHKGTPSPDVIVWTDVQSPGKPEIMSLTCKSGNTLFLEWMRPEVFYRTVDVYAVHYRARQVGAEMEWEQQMVETVNNTINHMVRELSANCHVLL